MFSKNQNKNKEYDGKNTDIDNINKIEDNIDITYKDLIKRYGLIYHKKITSPFLKNLIDDKIRENKKIFFNRFNLKLKDFNSKINIEPESNKNSFCNLTKYQWDLAFIAKMQLKEIKIVKKNHIAKNISINYMKKNKIDISNQCDEFNYKGFFREKF